MNLSVLGWGRTSKWALLLCVSHLIIDVLPVLYCPTSITCGFAKNSNFVTGWLWKCRKCDSSSIGNTTSSYSFQSCLITSFGTALSGGSCGIARPESGGWAAAGAAAPLDPSAVSAGSSVVMALGWAGRTTYTAAHRPWAKAAT